MMELKQLGNLLTSLKEPVLHSEPTGLKPITKPFPFYLSWTQNEVSSARTLQQPEYIPLSPSLDLEGFWAPIQDSDSDYSETKTCYTFPSLDESEMET